MEAKTKEAKDDIVRVLLVEDSTMATTIVSAYLERGLPDHELTTAASLGEAMGVLQIAPLDVILLDLNLPDSTGLDTFISIDSHPTKLPVVILSGDDDQNLAVEAVRHGAQDYLIKSKFDDAHLSRCIRFALERSRRMRLEKEVTGAQRIQKKLYPRRSPDVPEFDIAGVAYPAENVSGDYFDYIPMSNDRLGIVIGDVSGHGLGPALLMAETRAYLHALTFEAGVKDHFFNTENLGLVMSRTNQLLMTSPSWMFVTLFFLCLDPKTMSYTYASAGHRILHVLADGTHLERDSTGPALGLSDEANFEMAGPFPVCPGDTIFMGTDGFEETESTGKLFGVHGIVSCINDYTDETSLGVIRNLKTKIDTFTGRVRQADDMTAVVLRRKMHGGPL